MPVALENLIDAGYSDGGFAMSNMQDARNDIFTAGTHIGNQSWTNAKNSLQQCADSIGQFLKYAYQDDVWYESMRRDWKDALYWINDNWPSGGDPYELTMQKILDTIWASNKLESFHFVSYIDAMRASIWNVKINEQHLQEWYNHFSE